MSLAVKLAAVAAIAAVLSSACIQEGLAQDPYKVSKSVKISDSSNISYNELLNGYLNGRISYVLSELEKRRNILSPDEKSLLARVVWKMSYPYDEMSSLKACQIMEDALNKMPEGKSKNNLTPLYAQMLISTGRAEQALNIIDKLTSTGDVLLSFLISTLMISCYNELEKFNDAYAYCVKTGRAFDIKAMPAELQSRFFAVHAKTYTGLNEHRKAVELYKNAILLDKGIFRIETDLNYRFGESLLRTGNAEAAIGRLEKATNLGPLALKAKSVVMLADALRDSGLRKLSEVLYMEASGLKGPGSAVAKLRIAELIEKDGRDVSGNISDETFERLMKIYKGILKEYPDSSAVAAFNMARTYALHGDFPSAFLMYHNAWLITRQPDPVHTYAKKAAAALFTKLSLEEAPIRDKVLLDAYLSYKDGVLKDLNDPSTILNLSLLLYAAGYTENASEMALNLKSSNLEYIKYNAISLYAEIETSKGNLANALQMTEESLTHADYLKNADEVKLRKGELLMMLGRYSEASAYLKSLENDKADIRKLLLSADLYDRFKDSRNKNLVLDKIISVTGKGSDVIEYALFTRACDIALTDRQKSLRLLEGLTGKYPGSLLKNRALLLMFIIGNGADETSMDRATLQSLNSGSETIIGRMAVLSEEERKLKMILKRYFNPETKSVNISAVSGNKSGVRP